MPDIDDDVLEWWRMKEAKWPRLAKLVKQYFSPPRLIRGRRACLLGGGQDAHGPQQIGQGHDARALAVRRVQHRLTTHYQPVNMPTHFSDIGSLLTNNHVGLN